MIYCQIVVGAPGCGKSTYCNGMQKFLQAIGRETVIVNMDPGNENVLYESAFDIVELITVHDVMEEMHLGPNGALLYSMEWITKNLDIIHTKLKPLEDKYILFDFPGQAELYTHDKCIKILLDNFKSWGYSCVAVHLLDSYLCINPSNFIAGAMMALCIMCNLELPHVNILSKVDQFETIYNTSSPFPLDFYTNIDDINMLIDYIDPSNNLNTTYIDEGIKSQDEENCEDDYELCEEIDSKGNRYLINKPIKKKYIKEEYKKINKLATGLKNISQSMCEILSNYSLVNFLPLAIEDKERMQVVSKCIDKASGYIYSSRDLNRIQNIINQT